MIRNFTNAEELNSTVWGRPAKGWTGGISFALKHVIEILWLWHDRARQRRQLARLTSYQLKDICISKTMAAFEADKPFWKA